MITIVIPPELVERLGGPKVLDAWVVAIRQADRRSKSPKAFAEALRGHVRALEQNGYDPSHLWPRTKEPT